MYTFFFAIFTYVVIIQLNVEANFQIDRVVRHSLLGQDDKLQAVRTHGDFFQFLLSDFNDAGEFDESTWPNGGILATLFDPKLYNGQQVAAADLGMLFQFNKLVGGVLITQERSIKKKCPPSAYQLFYKNCYDGELMEAEPCNARKRPDGSRDYSKCSMVMQNTTRQNKQCGAEDRGIMLDPSATDQYEEYLAKREESKFGRWRDADGLPKIKGAERTRMLADLNVDMVEDSFEYRYDKFGYSAWLSLADGYETNRKKVVQLRDNLWLDLNTRKVELKFIFYNGNVGSFSYVAVSTDFSKYGTYKPFDPEATAVQKRGPGGPRIAIGTVNMEPYITREDFSRLFFEVIFAIMVFYYVFSFAFEFLKALWGSVSDGNFIDILYNPEDEFWVWVDSIGAVYLAMDFVNYICHVIYIVTRMRIVWMSVCNPVYVPTPSYNVIFEEISALTRYQLSINFFSVLFGVFRFFKYYQFQPRLQVVNKTLASSVEHIIHFMIIMMIMHMTFSMIGYLNFGPYSRDFSTLGNTMLVMANAVLSGVIDFGPKIGDTNMPGFMGNLLFHLFHFLVFMIMLNIFVGILMDGYAAAQEEGQALAERNGREQPDSVIDDVNKFVGLMEDKMPRPGWWTKPIDSWKYDHSKLLTALHRLDHKIPAPHYDEEKYAKELQDLRDEVEMATKRIEEIESMADPGHNMYLPHAPYHAYWNKKVCTWEQIAKEMKETTPATEEPPSVEFLSKLYEDAVEHAEEEEEEEPPEEEHGNHERTHMLERFLGEILQENAKLRKEMDEGIRAAKERVESERLLH